MAFITDNMGIEGGIGNMSAYRMRGIDKMVVRTKGGATKAKIKTDVKKLWKKFAKLVISFW